MQKPHRTIAATAPIRHQARETASLIPIVTARKESKTRLAEILDASGVHDDQRAVVENVFGLLDDACLGKLETFKVLYNNPKHRGLAGKGTILVSGTVADQELVGLLLHEGLGHFRDITCLTGTPESGISAFRDGGVHVYNDDPSVEFYSLSWLNEKTRKPEARREDFVTGYAYDGDNFEDLAESVTYYVTREQTFRLRAKSNVILAQKLAWLDTHMSKTRNIAQDDAEWDGNIAWDATKLSFRWTNDQ